MADSMKQTDAYANFKHAVAALGDDKVDLISKALCDVLNDDEDEFFLDKTEARLFTILARAIAAFISERNDDE